MNDPQHLALLAMLHQQHRGTHIGQAMDHAEATLFEVVKRQVAHGKHQKDNAPSEDCFYCKNLALLALSLTPSNLS